MKKDSFKHKLASLNDAVASVKAERNESWNEALTSTLPEQINSNEESDAWTEILNELFNIGEGNLSPEENKLFVLVAGLIEDYEDRTLEPIPDPTPVELLKLLIREHYIEPKDLTEIFASPEDLSDVLSGTHQISEEQAKRLGKRFCVYPEAFIEK